jgi:AbiV family abortive infection protein
MRRTPSSIGKGMTPDSLLQGAWYALLQSAHLLTDAVLLFGAGRASTAAGLALLAREELGRFRLLLDLRKNAVAGRLPSVGELKNSYKDHRIKQQWGQTGVTMRGLPANWTDKFLEKIKQKPMDEELILKDMFKPLESKRRRDPQDRHELRGKCFYVDVESSGAVWNRPWLMSKEEAERIIIDATNDYHMMLLYVRRKQQYFGAELGAALDAWADKPELPFIVWPQILAQLVSPVRRTYE